MFKNLLHLMIPWMQIYDNNNYGKWLVEFWTEISTLTKAIDEHMVKGLFAQFLTGNPYSCLPLDMGIEITMDKGLKTKQCCYHTLEMEISSTESESSCTN